MADGQSDTPHKGCLGGMGEEGVAHSCFSLLNQWQRGDSNETHAMRRDLRRPRGVLVSVRALSRSAWGIVPRSEPHFGSKSRDRVAG